MIKGVFYQTGHRPVIAWAGNDKTITNAYGIEQSNTRSLKISRRIVAESHQIDAAKGLCFGAQCFGGVQHVEEGPFSAGVFAGGATNPNEEGTPDDEAFIPASVRSFIVRSPG